MTKIKMSCNNKIQISISDGRQLMVLQRNTDYLPMARDNFNEKFINEITAKRIPYSIQEPKTDKIMGFVLDNYLYCQDTDKEVVAKKLVQFLIQADNPEHQAKVPTE